MPRNEIGCSQIEDQTAIHLLVEAEIEIVLREHRTRELNESRIAFAGKVIDNWSGRIWKSKNFTDFIEGFAGCIMQELLGETNQVVLQGTRFAVLAHLLRAGLPHVHEGHPIPVSRADLT